MRHHVSVAAVFALAAQGGCWVDRDPYVDPDAGADPDGDTPDPDGGNDGRHLLTVAVGGNGGGAVTSTPAGIDCPAVACSAEFDDGTTIQLTATPSGSVFLGWSDACSGNTGCSVNLTQNTMVGALFGVPGDALWFNQVGSSTGDYARDVVFADGHVFASGWFQGTVDIGGQALTSDGSNDAFVAKLDAATGTAVWAVRFGSTDLDSAEGIAVDANGDVFVVGKFQGTVDFGGGNRMSAGDSDIFVVKLNGETGAHIWSARYGGLGNDGSGSAIAVSGANEIVVAGTFSSASLTFGGATLTNAGAGVGDVYVAKLGNTAGAHVWSKRLGGAASDSLAAIAVDSAGDVVLTGEFLGTTNYGGSDLMSAGGSDIFLVKLGAAAGAHLFSLRFGSTSTDGGADVAVDSARRILLTGSSARPPIALPV